MDFNTININQLPGFFSIMDLDGRCLAANAVALNWTGHRTLDLIIGSTYGDMPCKASEQHENFILQDRVILNDHNGYGKIIGLYCYHNDAWKIILAEKYPIKDDMGKTIALGSYMTDLTDAKTIDVTKFINLIDFNQKNQPMQQTGFILGHYPQQLHLTKRQEECLFFLIRGKTAKEMSAILNLSKRTIEQFIEQLKNIFVCNTKSELIDKALEIGYMCVIPKSLFQTI